MPVLSSQVHTRAQDARHLYRLRRLGRGYTTALRGARGVEVGRGAPLLGMLLSLITGLFGTAPDTVAMANPVWHLADSEHTLWAEWFAGSAA